MANINGSLSYSIQPVGFDNSDLAGAFYDNRANYLKSANDPLRYQVVWQTTNLTEATEPSIENGTTTSGDVVYVKFIVEVCVNTDDAAINGWEEIARITKTRDIINKKFDTGTAAPNHRFTVDVSQVVSDELSYSLCPINKGSWKSYKYGGMNGGAIMQDNVIANTGTMGNPVSLFNVSKNGTFRRLQVRAKPYVILANGDIESAGNYISNTITVINSVNQISSDGVYYANANYGGNYNMSNVDIQATRFSYGFLSRYNNYLYNTGSYGKKLVRIDEQAEFLNFYFHRIESANIGGSTGQNTVRACGMLVETFKSDGSDENQFYIRDFEDNLIRFTDTTLGMVVLKDYQNVMTTQNVSPSFINNNDCYTYNDSGTAAFPYWTVYSGSKITELTDCYRVSIYRFSADNLSADPRRTSEYRYYQIDREDEKEPYKFVRFHWLNDLGATDSYTAKRNIAEGYTINRNTIETNTTDKTWYQSSVAWNGSNTTPLDSSVFKSDTMRGGDIYKGGREITSVEAQRVQSVYTEPLNIEEAEWLSKMMLSPNVWIEMDNEATKLGNLYNSHLRPSTKEYTPIIITNSDVETVNQEQGLVTFNIEYTLAHKTITQSN